LSSGEVTFFIDGHKGSPAALRAVLPQAPWRACVRHLITNKKYEGNGTRLFTGGLPSGGDAYQGPVRGGN
ncbi:unnamed protein product, partial [Ectocarpus sp. 12 AP-2014]